MGGRSGGAERTGRPGALSGARDFFPEGRGAARRTRTPAPRRGPRVTDRGGPEPPAGGAALRGPRRVQTARVWLRLRGRRGRGAAAEVGGLPGQRLRPPPTQRGGIPGLSGARGRRRTSRRWRRAVPGCKQPGGLGFPGGKRSAQSCLPKHLAGLGLVLQAKLSGSPKARS